MSDTASPPPLPSSSAPASIKTHTTTMLRNVIVSVTSTVLGASLIYFLGFQHKDTDDFLTVKEATKQGWNSYVTYENTYTDNLISFQKEMNQKEGINKYLAGLKKESAKFEAAVEELKKKKHIDKDLVIALTRRLENEKPSLEIVEEYKKNQDSIMNSNKTPEEKRDAIVTETENYMISYKGMYERAINDIQEIAKTLSARYAEQFSMNDFKVVQMYDQVIKATDSIINVLKGADLTPAVDSTHTSPANNTDTAFATHVDSKSIMGTWYSNGSVISFFQDGKMSWAANTNDKATGTWKLINDKLAINAVMPKTNKKIVWVFNLTKITHDSFTIVLDYKPNTIYNLVRIQN